MNTTATAGKTKESGGRAVTLVAAGILLSRLSGLISFRIFAHYLGTSMAADAYRAAFRVPNVLQNLLGEGVLSASFIPVYARLRAEGRDDEAGELAGAAFSMLALVASLIVAAGVLAAPLSVAVLAPGFHGEKRELTIALVRIVFPGTGLLVFSAWCLGVLNSHRRFFLSYCAPVVMNFAIIGALLWKGGYEHADANSLVRAVSWASVLGALLQFLVQAPVVYRLLRPLRGATEWRTPHAVAVVAAFVPVFLSRGVFQISGFIDLQIASFLPGGNVLLNYAQTLYMLPVSLFGMSVSAAELPAMSGATGTVGEIAETLRIRVGAGLDRIAFFVVPSAVAFLTLGHVIVAAVFQSGLFGSKDVLFVWAALAGSGVGLLAQTLGRLYSSTFYALRDTRTPLRFALVRVGLTLGLGYLLALPLPRLLGIDPNWGVAGLTSSAGVAGWVEFALLRRALRRRIGDVDYPASRLLRLWAAALAGAAVGWAVLAAIPGGHPVLGGGLVLVSYGIVYLLLAHLLGVGRGLDGLFRRFRRR